MKHCHTPPIPANENRQRLWVQLWEPLRQVVCWSTLWSWAPLLQDIFYWPTPPWYPHLPMWRSILVPLSQRWEAPDVRVWGLCDSFPIRLYVVTKKMDPVGKQSAGSQTSLAARGTGSESKGRVGALGIANGSLWRIRFTGTMLMFIFPLFVVTMAPKFPRCSLPRFSKKLNDLISHGFLKSQFECCYWFQVKVQTTTFYMLCVPWNQITEVKRTYFVMKNSWLTGFYQALGKIVSEKGNVGNLPSSLSYSSSLHQHLNFFTGFICLKNIFVALPNPLDKREVCASSLEKRRELWVFSVTSLTWPVSLFKRIYKVDP